MWTKYDIPKSKSFIRRKEKAKNITLENKSYNRKENYYYRIYHQANHIYVRYISLRERFNYC